MNAHLHSLKFSTQILRPGFWLYVLVICLSDGQKLYYVGRTGDASSANAKSPFSRLCAHLGPNIHSNALRHRLGDRRVDLNTCQDLELVTYGPLDEQATIWSDHVPRRDKIHALERDLCAGMKDAGYEVINDVTCRLPSNADDWVRVRSAFAKFFDRLSAN